MNWQEKKLKLRALAASALQTSGVTSALQRSSAVPWRILTYHRVTYPENQPVPVQPGMYVRPETFRLHLKYLTTSCRVVPLEDLIKSVLANETIPPKTVALTFDDGWLDNHKDAFPLLKEFDAPATIFLATAFIGTYDYFWTDRVSQTISALQEADSYREQVLTLIQERFPPHASIRDAVQRLVKARDSDEFPESLDNIVETLKSMSPRDRKQVVDELFKLAKEFTKMKSERLFMNWAEVAEMSKANVSFGSHSHHHHRLTELSEAQLKDELLDSYQCLKANNLEISSAFCYPGGYLSEQTQKALSARGIRCALSTRTSSDLTETPPLLGRTHIHEDVTRTLPLFTSRVWGLL